VDTAVNGRICLRGTSASATDVSAGSGAGAGAGAGTETAATAIARAMDTAVAAAAGRGEGSSAAVAVAAALRPGVGAAEVVEGAAALDREAIAARGDLGPSWGNGRFVIERDIQKSSGSK
jgi:hypothetical protein